MAVTTTKDAKLPNDPVLLLAMVIEKIRCGELRVENFDLLQRPMTIDSMELVMALRSQRTYSDTPMRGPSSNPFDDIGDAMSAEVNVTQLSVGDIIKEIREFREWREARRERSRSEGAVAGPPPLLNTMESLTRAFKDGAISADRFKQAVRLLGTGASRPSFPQDWSPTDIIDDKPTDLDDVDDWLNSDSKDPRDIGTLTKVERAAQRRRAREDAAKADAERDKPSSAPPTRELILDD